MARFMVPRYIEFVDELPKTQATQRIIKADLRQSGSRAPARGTGRARGTAIKRARCPTRMSEVTGLMTTDGDQFERRLPGW